MVLERRRPHKRRRSRLRSRLRSPSPDSECQYESARSSPESVYFTPPLHAPRPCRAAETAEARYPANVSRRRPPQPDGRKPDAPETDGAGITTGRSRYSNQSRLSEQCARHRRRQRHQQQISHVQRQRQQQQRQQQQNMQNRHQYQCCLLNSRNSPIVASPDHTSAQMTTAASQTAPFGVSEAMEMGEDEFFRATTLADPTQPATLADLTSYPAPSTSTCLGDGDSRDRLGWRPDRASPSPADNLLLNASLAGLSPNVLIGRRKRRPR